MAQPTSPGLPWGRPPLELWCGSGILLRPWREEDAPALWELFRGSESHIARWETWVRRYVANPEPCRLQILQMMRDWQVGRDLSVGIWLDGALAGGAGLYGLQSQSVISSISYWRGHGFAHRGVASTAVKALTTIAFGVYGRPRIEIVFDVRNRPSARVAERCGYAYLGVRAGAVYHHGADHNGSVYDCLRPWFRNYGLEFDHVLHQFRCWSGDESDLA